MHYSIAWIDTWKYTAHYTWYQTLSFIPPRAYRLEKDLGIESDELKVTHALLNIKLFLGSYTNVKTKTSTQKVLVSTGLFNYRNR